MCRIISYNIHSGVGRDKQQDYRRIGNFLAQQDADVVLLQEMDTRPQDRAVQQDIHDICAGSIYHLVASPALSEPSGWYGNAILSRYPVLNNQTIDVSKAGFQPRNIQAVVLDTPKGPLTVINTHKGLKKHERRSQFALLHEYIAQRLHQQPTPLLVGGDFNEWQFFTNAFKQLNHTLNAHKIGATFPAHFPLFSLDRIWTSDDIRVKRIKRIRSAQTRMLSDHLPVLVDVELPQTPALAPPAAASMHCA